MKNDVQLLKKIQVGSAIGRSLQTSAVYFTLHLLAYVSGSDSLLMPDVLAMLIYLMCCCDSVQILETVCIRPGASSRGGN